MLWDQTLVSMLCHIAFPAYLAGPHLLILLCMSQHILTALPGLTISLFQVLALGCYLPAQGFMSFAFLYLHAHFHN